MLEGYSYMQQLYIIIGIGGGIITLLNIIRLFVGLDADIDFDSEIYSDFNGLKFISLYGIGAFLLMFGIVGFITDFSYNYNPIVSSLLAFLTGFIMMFIVALLFKRFKKLDSCGNVYINDAIGKNATVYTTVDKNKGTVKVIMNNDVETYYDALSINDDIFKFGEVVNIVDVINDKLLVSKISKIKNN